MDPATDSAFVPTSGASTPTAASTAASASMDAATEGPAATSSALVAPEPSAADSTPAAEASTASSTAKKGNALEAEVTQVLGNLRGFWGSVTKQVAPMLEEARKDISSGLAQAQTELHRLQAQAAEAQSGTMSSGGFASGAFADGLMPVYRPPSPPAPAPVDVKGKSKEVDHDAATAPVGDSITVAASAAGVNASELFSSWQAQLKSSTAAVQKNLKEAVAKNPNLDLKSIQKSLNDNLQKLDSALHLEDAEKFAEVYFNKATVGLKEAGEYLKEAVKVVPPEGGESAGVSWDGSDVWTLPTVDRQTGKVLFDKSDAQVAALTGLDQVAVRARRKDALMRQLRGNKAIFLVDPAEDEQSKIDFEKWLKEDVEAKGGIEGDDWTAKTWAELGPMGEGVELLKATRDELVPSQMTKQAFWTRYFFRIDQIEKDEQRRQAVIASQVEQKDDDFSWDADEEEDKPVTPKLPSFSTVPQATPATPTPATTNAASAATATLKPRGSAADSPRDSEESYDLVSEQGGVLSGNTDNGLAAVAKDEKKAAPAKEAAPTAADEDEDSDWE